MSIQTTGIEDIDKAMDLVLAGERALAVALPAHFPVGSEWLVRLRAGARTEKRMAVSGFPCANDAVVRFRCPSATSRTGWFYKNIHVHRIVERVS